MKSRILITVLFITCLSCKKSNPTPKTNPTIEGYWTGSTAYDLSPIIGIRFQTNGFARIYTTNVAPILDTNASTTIKSDGKYNLRGDTVNFNFAFAFKALGMNGNGIMNQQQTTMTGSADLISTKDDNLQMYSPISLTKAQ